MFSPAQPGTSGAAVAAAPSFSFGGSATTTAADRTQQPAPPPQASPAPPTGGAAAAAATTSSASPPGAVPSQQPLAPAPSAVKAPAAPSFLSEFQRSVEAGAVTAALATDIRTRFSAPFTVTASAAPAPSLSGAPSGPAVGAVTNIAWGATQSVSATAPTSQNPLGFPTSLTKGVGAAGQPSGQAATSQPASAAAVQASTMSDFLTVLLSCDSGYMNAYDNEADPGKNNAANKERIAGLHAAVGGVASASAAAIVEHLKKALAPSAVAYDSVNALLQGIPRSSAGAPLALAHGRTLVGVHAGGGHAVNHVGSNPIMAAAQCLYLLTRHFQMQPSFVKDGLDLVELLLTHVQTELTGRRMVHLHHFRDAPETSALCSLTWLIVLSIGNAMAVWKKVRATAGDAALGQNTLIRSDAVTTLGHRVTAMKKKFEDDVLASNAEAMGKHDDALGFLSSATGRLTSGRSGGGGGVGRNAAGVVTAGSSTATAAALLRSGAAHVAAHHRWLAVVQSFLSILTLVEGCMWRAKGEEKGFDRALVAFTGEKGNPLSETVGGKVAKRIVQLAPAPSTLAIPIDYIYMVPYEMLSYIFDDMLPLVRHVALLEVDSDRAYLEDLQRVEEWMLPGQEGGGVGVGGAGPGGIRAQGAFDGVFAVGRRDAYSGRAGEAVDAVGVEMPVASSFTTGMASILGCLAECLERLSPDVLDPDLDSDCAATFFIFRNCVKHMAQVFALQRAGAAALWENFTLVLVSEFLDVLAMIGRNPQYLVRVIAMLTEAQAECEEMQWGNLVNQALQCAGFTTSDGVAEGMPRRRGGVGVPVPGTGAGGNSFLNGSSNTGAPSANPLPNGDGEQQLPFQYTQEFARKCQQQYISSFFMFLRQAFAHPLFRDVVAEYMSLELALSFVFAPRQSQSMLGSTLSLISAIVVTPQDAALVWAFLDSNRLLQPPKSSPWKSGTTGLGSAAGSHADPSHQQHHHHHYHEAAGRENGAADAYENLSILGHCMHECTIGDYSITIGYLNLMISLFRSSVPSTASFALFASMAHFIAEDVFIGASKRSFVLKTERYTVIALAAAALRHALSVRFVAEGEGRGSGNWATIGNAAATRFDGGVGSLEERGASLMIPFATVMASMKAPADVTSEALKILYKASSTPYELVSHQRAAARQCLQLLTAAIRAEGKPDSVCFSFDSRTTQSVSLAYHTLFLCCANDPLLMRAALALLLQFPRSVMAQATEYWASESHRLSGVVGLFAELLHPDAVAAAGSIVRAPPVLIILDTVATGGGYFTGSASSLHDVHSAGTGESGEDLATENRSLLLDLLLLHAQHAELSIAIWLCGLWSAAHGASIGNVSAEASLVSHLRETKLLDSVVAGATSSAMERASPGLAVKYVKLLYSLRSNRLYGSTLMRGFMESACQDLFLYLQRFRADQCSPVILSKYAYVLRLLALEALDVHHTRPDHLDVNRMVVPSISAEVLLSLLHPSRHSSGGNGHTDVASFAGRLPDAANAANGSSGGGGALTIGYDDGTDAGAASAAKGHDGDGGTVAQTLPRGLSADVSQWLSQCFHQLSNFPICDAPNGRDRYLVPVSQDGIAQFNIEALYEAFQREQFEHDLAPLTTEDLRTKLGPFIEANQCFLEYASAVNFVQGWCQLLDISCSVVRGIRAPRLRAFFLCIVDAMDETRRMTQAAQELVAYHLFSTLSTVAAQLKQRCLSGLEEEESEMEGGAAGVTSLVAYERPMPASGTLSLMSRSANDTQHGGGGGGAASRSTGLVRTGGDAVSAVQQSGAGAVAHRAGVRRPRDDTVHSASPFPARRGSLYATEAGERSNLLSLASRTRLSKSALFSAAGGQGGYGYRNRDLAGDELSMDALMRGRAGAGDLSGAAANQTLFRRLVLTLAQWGTRLPVIRGDAYTALLFLAQIPRVSVDDFVVFRCKDTLFDLLAADVIGAETHGVPTPLGRQRALMLLQHLLQNSPALCDAFCDANEDGAGGVGQRPLRCATALLHDVNRVVSNFLARTEGGGTVAAAVAGTASPASDPGFASIAGPDLGGVLAFLRAAFDYLALLSLQHAPQVLQANVVTTCIAMECWNRCAQVIFGRVPGATPARLGRPRVHELDTTAVTLEQNREVLKRLLLGTVRWFNVMQATMGDAPTFVAQMQDFVRLRRQLIESVMEMPQSTSGAAATGLADPPLPVKRPGGVVSLAGVTDSGPNTVTLTLLSELTALLHGLASSPLAEECRALMTEMALPELLLTISSESFAQHCRNYVRGDYFESQLPDSMESGCAQGSFPSPAAGSSNRGNKVSSTVRGRGPAGSNAPHSDALSLAARNLDLVALSVRNLSHFLLRSEYGLRAFSENPDASDTQAMFPRLRSNPSHVMSVLSVTQQVAHVLESDGAAAGSGVADVSDLRLECHLFALHALVCLVHSFALPLPVGEKESHIKHFLPYVRTLPLQDMLAVLQNCQAAVYKQKDFNADYRTGVAGLRMADGTWAVGAANSLSNAITSARISSGAKVVQGREGGDGTATLAVKDGRASEPGTPALPSLGAGNAEKKKQQRAATPSTPLLNADAGNWLMGTNQQSLDARHRAAAAVTTAGPHAALSAGLGGASEAAVGVTMRVDAAGPGSGASHTSLLALNHSGSSRSARHALESDADGVSPGDGAATAVVAAGAAPEQTTIGQLWRPAAVHDTAAEETWKALASSASSLPSWEDVLSMESSVRQVKVAIANALRVVSSAIDVASRP